jgi:hypothetical protein
LNGVSSIALTMCSSKRATFTATVGNQQFVVTLEEGAKDTQEPAIT